MIREATLADVPILVQMGCRQLAALYEGVIAQNSEQLEALTTNLITSPNGVVFVAERDGTPVGMIGLIRYAHHLSAAPTAGEVAWWVEPEARGLGPTLLRRAECWALEMGCTHIQMVAPNVRVGRLYERRGYRPVETSYQRVVTPECAAITVIDDVLPDVDRYRADILNHPFGDVRMSPEVVFHGIAPVDDTLAQWIEQRFPQLKPQLSFARRSPEGQDEPNFIHTDRDMGEWTGIYYLTADPAPGDGTTFWRWRKTGAIGSHAVTEDEFFEEWAAWRDREQWEPWRVVSAKPNRLVLFPAPYFHSRALEDNYGAAESETARLIQVVFGTGVCAPVGGA
jgi:RimJ/RimL family protein N-acetyltransferase